MSVFREMPLEILRRIFEYDDTYRKIMTSQILPHVKDVFRERDLDRGYTIRNFFEPWASTPRYYEEDDGRMYGSYLRHGRRSRRPL
jgi:hypothetical protein